MKKLIRIWCAGACAVLIAASCQNDKPEPSRTGGEKAVITVGIAPAAPTRSVISDEATVSEFENKIFGFDAYVFDWNTGFLEAAASSPDGRPVTISNVNTASQKRVFVITNCANIYAVPSLATDTGLTHYDDLQFASMGFGSQFVTDAEIANPTHGLLMTGENPTPITLSAGDANEVNITVKRVAAKIRLGNIAFADELRMSDLALFDIDDAGIQKVIGATSIGPVAIVPVYDSEPYYFSGYNNYMNPDTTLPELRCDGIDLASFISALHTALSPADPDMTLGEAVAAASGFDSGLRTKAVNAFWYVLPNNADGVSPTLLTLHGSYDGTEYYYPIEINSPDRNPVGSSTGAGVYIERNTVYNLNVTFNGLAGSTNPDTPGKLVSMSVTLTPQEWAGPVTQNVVW